MSGIWLSPRFFLSAALFSAILDPRTAGRALLHVARVEPVQIIFQLLAGGGDEFLQLGKIAVFVIDRLDAGAIDRQQLAPEQIKAPAQDHKLPENFLERGAIAAPKTGDRLEIRFQAAQQPDDLDVAMRLGFQPAARAHPVQIAIDGEFEEIARRAAGTARRLRSHPRETCCLEVKTCDKRIDQANRIAGAGIIVDRLR